MFRNPGFIPEAGFPPVPWPVLDYQKLRWSFQTWNWLTLRGTLPTFGGQGGYQASLCWDLRGTPIRWLVGWCWFEKCLQIPAGLQAPEDPSRIPKAFTHYNVGPTVGVIKFSENLKDDAKLGCKNSGRKQAGFGRKQAGFGRNYPDQFFQPCLTCSIGASMLAQHQNCWPTMSHQSIYHSKLIQSVRC